MKNLKYWETVFEIKISQFRLPERLNQRNEKNTIEKIEYADKYVFWERGVTFHPPYKKFRPRNFDKGKMNTGETRVDNENKIKWNI